MLEQKDLCAIAELIDSRIGKTEDMIKETNKRVSEVETKLTDKIEGVEKKLTDRIEGVEKKLSNRIERVEKRVSEVEKKLVLCQDLVQIKMRSSAC